MHLTASAAGPGRLTLPPASCAWLVVACVLTGCGPNDSVAPGVEQELVPSYSLDGGDSKTVTLPTTQMYDAFASVTVDSFPGPRVVTIAVVANDLLVIRKNYPPGEKDALVANATASGYKYSPTTCVGIVKVAYPGNAMASPSEACGGAPRTLTWLVRGTGTILRQGNMPGTVPPACGPAPYIPCYYYGGGAHQVEIRVVPIPLALRANRTAITPGQSVVFTASANPVTYAGLTVPMTVQQWRWVPDSGATSTPCGQAKNCSFVPPASGTMYVDAEVNGVTQTKSVHVLVDSCITGDSLLDTKKLRDALKNNWNNTPKTGAPEDRMERMSDCVPNGDGCEWQLLPPNGADYCSHPRSGINPNSEGTIHSHPWNTETEFVPIPLLPHCIPPGRQPPGPGSKWVPGPSGDDFANLDAADTHWVIDANFIHKITGGLSDEERRLPRPFPRKFGSCDPLHP
jgi:hypothetical protein